MTSIILLGLLMGMRHAIESDHVAAVASLSADAPTRRRMIELGALWGGGHALTLFAVGAVFVAFDWGAPEVFSSWLELVVGFMLVVLGADLVRRVIRDRIHFHIHAHDRVKHVHVHAHDANAHARHDAAQHAHRHARGVSVRAFTVGMVHGMAGSAALVVLVLGTIESFWLGLGYMALFGVGSLVGMALLSLTISVPLGLSAKSLTWGYNGLQGAIGAWTLYLGGTIVIERGLPLF